MKSKSYVGKWEFVIIRIDNKRSSSPVPDADIQSGPHVPDTEPVPDAYYVAGGLIHGVDKAMRTSTLHFILKVVTIAALTCAHAGAQDHNEFVFKHVNVLPMSKEAVLADYSVIVREGKVQQMGPSSSVAIPQGAVEIDAKGKFMIPALSDMHVHLEGDAWNIMFPVASKFTSEEISFEDILFLYVAHGITTIEVMSAFPEHIALREKIRNNEMIGPRMILSRMIDGAGKAWPPPISTWVNNADEAAKAVSAMHDQGYDRVKVYSFLDKASYDTILATAKRLRMPVDGHIPLSTSVEYVLASGQNMIAHPEEVMKFAKSYTPEQVGYFSGLIANSNTWVTSTLIIHRNLIALLKDSAAEFSKPGTEYLHPMGLGVWSYIYTHLYKPIPPAAREKLVDGFNSFQKPLVYEFHKKGGKLLTGTDPLMPSTLPAISLHLELEELVNTGLTPYEALRVSTTNTHEFLGELDRAGTIESGKDANLVLLDKNPLENISNTRKIAGVMTQGRWISKEQIESRLGQIRTSYAVLRLKKLQ
ncbi:MAG: amidohydrolase family protein [Bacteroidota bacterium]